MARNATSASLPEEHTTVQKIIVIIQELGNTAMIVSQCRAISYMRASRNVMHHSIGLCVPASGMENAAVHAMSGVGEVDRFLKMMPSHEKTC